MPVMVMMTMSMSPTWPVPGRNVINCDAGRLHGPWSTSCITLLHGFIDFFVLLRVGLTWPVQGSPISIWED